MRHVSDMLWNGFQSIYALAHADIVGHGEGQTLISPPSHSASAHTGKWKKILVFFLGLSSYIAVHAFVPAVAVARFVTIVQVR